MSTYSRVEDSKLFAAQSDLIGYALDSNLPSAEIAQLTGETEEWVNRFLNGKVYPHLEDLDIFASAFGLKVELVPTVVSNKRK